MPLFENIVLHLLVGQSVCDDGRSIFRPNDVRSISFYLFARKLPNLVQWMLLDNRWSLLIFRSHGPRSRSNCRFLYKCCLLKIFWNLCLKVVKLGTVRINNHPQLMLRSYSQRSRSNYWSWYKCCLLNIF